jgi:hypothetical protein
MRSAATLLFALLIVGASVSQEQQTKVIDAVTMQSSHTEPTKDGGSIKVIFLDGSYASYKIACNEDEQTCTTPEVNETYALVPSPATVYKCENVALKVPSYKTPQGRDQYRGFYCLKDTYPKSH